MESSSVVLSSPPGSPELRAALYSLDASSRKPPRPALKRKPVGKMGDDYKAHLRAIHDLPMSIDLIRGIVEKLHECKHKGSLRSDHLRVAADMMVVRPPDLRKGTIKVGNYLYPSGATNKDGVLKDNPYSAYVPSLISQCSESSKLAVIPCKRCAMGSGAFASCRVDENHGGCCLNCWHSISTWDCTLFDRKGEMKPKKKKAVVKTERQNTASLAGTPAITTTPVRKRKRVVDLSPTPEAAPKRVKIPKKPTKRAATVIAELEALLVEREDYGEHSATTRNHEISQTEEMDINYSLQPIASVPSESALNTVTEATGDERTIDETSMVDQELIEDVPVDVWYEDVINNETIPPWLRECHLLDTTTPTLFNGTRKSKDAFQAELKRARKPHLLLAPLIKKKGFIARNSTSTQISSARQTARNSHLSSILKPIIFASSKSAFSGSVPPWQSYIDAPADTQNATHFQGTRKTSELFYMHFGLAKRAQAKPASALLSVPAFRNKKPPLPASARASSFAPLVIPRDERSTVPSVTANTLKSFARHAFSFVFD